MEQRKGHTLAGTYLWYENTLSDPTPEECPALGPPKSSSSSSDMCSEDLLTAKESGIKHKDKPELNHVAQFAHKPASSPSPPMLVPFKSHRSKQDIRALDNCGLNVYPIVTHAHAELPAPTSVPFPSLSMSLSSSLLA